jgi:D-alanyl-D-alanine carboxypeptidase (penicillin-binding protein 5/6)
METFSMRRLAALVMAAVLSFVIAVPAMADPGRYAPSPEIEDGALLKEPSIPSGSPQEPWTAPVQSAATKGPVTTNLPVVIKSPSAVLIESKSGRVLFEKNAHERRNPASVTKIMTLILAFDAIRDGKVKMADKVTISHEAAEQVGTIIFADTGETFTLGQLLQSVAVGSANDAAVSVAEHVSGSVESFVQVMNAKAKVLGMNDTQFQNPTGLSAENHLTSALDIALMSRYAANNYPELMKLTAIYGADLQVPWRKNGPTFRLWNNNKLLVGYQGADGLKTGWTQAAGYCLAATAVRNKVRMISVVMGAETWQLRNAEASKLLDYGFSNYTSVEIAALGQVMGSINVAHGKLPVVHVVPQSLFGVSVTKGDQSKVQTEVKMKKRIEAPVLAGQIVGEITASLDGKPLGAMPLVTAHAVQKANLWESLMAQFKRTFTLQ